MDLFSFVVFSFNTRYMLRWILAGIMLVVPVLDFLSLGYLWRTSGLSMIGGVGLPTWERKGELWREGARMAYIIILYEALPSFLFSLGFLLSSVDTFVTHFIGRLMMFFAVVAFVLCSYFLPFAFCTFVESMEVRKAFDFEKIAGAMMEVFAPYTLGYILSILCLYITYELHRIPIVGVILLLTLPFYVLLVATYYFTQLFRKTRLSSGELP
jgi:hypothetical protein